MLKNPKVGDRVICIPITEEIERIAEKFNCDPKGGFGYISNKILTIRAIDGYDNYKVLWFYERSAGIYDFALTEYVELNKTELDNIDQLIESFNNI